MQFDVAGLRMHVDNVGMHLYVANEPDAHSSIHLTP